ncbi:MAG: HEAT repeat domain-containing protein [Candidatus Thorarchaeota archaeon]
MARGKKAKKICVAEQNSVVEMRDLAMQLESPDLGEAYKAAGTLADMDHVRTLLPKAWSLHNSEDPYLKKLMFRLVAKGAYSRYLADFFDALLRLNPAEREQILQSIDERFISVGAPTAKEERKNWIEALEKLGREHQSTTFSIMSKLGKTGYRWVRTQIRENLDSISFGAVEGLSGFSPKYKKRLFKLLAERAADERRNLLRYICGIADQDTVNYLMPFLSDASWKERAQIAGAVASAGIDRAAGIVMDLVSDPDWRVKQALLNNLSIEKSRLTSIIKVLGYFVADSHTRVRTLAERAILRLGVEKCNSSSLEEQRSRIQHRFRKELLRAASRNSDINSEWLGVSESNADPIPYIPDTEEGESESQKAPIGVSLDDIESIKPEEPKQSDSKKSLLSALLDEKEKTQGEDKTIEEDDIDARVQAIDSDLIPSERFVRLLKILSETSKGGVSLDMLKERAKEVRIDDDTIDKIISDLEKQGIIYSSGDGTISYVDLEL